MMNSGTEWTEESARQHYYQTLDATTQSEFRKLDLSWFSNNIRSISTVVNAAIRRQKKQNTSVVKRVVQFESRSQSILGNRVCKAGVSPNAKNSRACHSLSLLSTAAKNVSRFFSFNLDHRYTSEWRWQSSHWSVYSASFSISSPSGRVEERGRGWIKPAANGGERSSKTGSRNSPIVSLQTLDAVIFCTALATPGEHLSTDGCQPPNPIGNDQRTGTSAGSCNHLCGRHTCHLRRRRVSGFIAIIGDNDSRLTIGVGDGGSEGTCPPPQIREIFIGQLLRKIRTFLGQKSRDIRKFF